jgi:hypothetical protein
MTMSRRTPILGLSSRGAIFTCGRSPVVLTVITAPLLIAGCSADSSPGAPIGHATSSAASSAGASLTASKPRTGAAPAPRPAHVAAEVDQVATRYLAIRENAVTSRDPRGWLAGVRPEMTPDGWTRLSKLVGDSGGFPAAIAQTHHWSVRVVVACQSNPDAGLTSAVRMTVTCSVTDRTIDAAKRPVPTAVLPHLWPYTGTQPPALLDMRRVHNHWRIDRDRTGEAG